MTSSDENELPDGRNVDVGQSEIDRLIASYIDRYNLGEALDAETILEEQPEWAPEILEQLETFVEIGGTADAGLRRELGDFQLVRKLGAGGMGVVYEAWEGSLDRKVALKLLPAGAAADDRALRRFLREARVAGRLRHRSIVAVYATGLASGTPYYSMEYVDGETLAALRTRLGLVDGPPASEACARRALIEWISLLPEADVDPMRSGRDRMASLATSSLHALRSRFARALALAFSEVARGLQHAHEEGIVHRDIKPSNLILERESARGNDTPRAGLRIVDFGLARLSGDQTLTVDGAFLGTPLYMSPEQVRSAHGQKVEIDRRTDVYSLGLCLHEALAWRHPFASSIGPQLYRDALEREPPPLPSWIHRDLDAIVSKCLQKSPRDRYTTAEALAQDLDRFVRCEPVEAKPQGPWRRRARQIWTARRRLARGAVWVLTAAVMAIAFHHFVTSRGEVRSARIWEGDVSRSYVRVSLDGTRLAAVDWTAGNIIVADLGADPTTWYEITGNQDWETLTHYGNGIAISPDGKQVCYTWEHRDTGVGELYVVDVGVDAPPRRLDPGDTSYYPEDWSRDGSLVLVQRRCARVRSVPSGCSLVLLSVVDGRIAWEWPVTGRERLLQPRLSPDGEWVLYQREEEQGSGRWDILAVSTSDPTADEIAVLRGHSDDRLVGFSPDGGEIVFSSDRDGQRDLWTGEFAAGSILGEIRLVQRAFDGSSATITSDGSLYTARNVGGSELFLGDFDEHGPLDISRAESASQRFQRCSYSPAWSADGTRLAYRVDRQSEGAHTESAWKLVVQDVASGTEAEIHPRPALPDSFRMFGPHWLDSETLIFVSGPLDETTTLWTINVHTGIRRRLVSIDAELNEYSYCVGAATRAVWYTSRGALYRIDLPEDLSIPTDPEPRRLAELRGGNIELSPDESSIAYRGQRSIRIIPADGAAAPRVVTDLGTGPDRIDRILGWGGRSALLVRAGSGDLCRLDVASGEHWPIARASSGEFEFVEVSPGTSPRLAYTVLTNHLWISRLEGFLR